MKYEKVDFPSIGEKIRNARRERKLSQDGLIELLSVKYGVKLGRNRLSQLENGGREKFELDLFIAICDIFDWDMGYLFDEYLESTKTKHIICQETGLSEAAVNKIVAWKNADDRRKLYSNHLSELLENKDTESLLGDIGEFLAYAALEVKAVNNNDPKFAVELLDLQMARLWNISRVFSNIIEIMGAAQNREGDNSNGKT